MNENSWLHWSNPPPFPWIPVGSHFHEWKFMAPLKPRIYPGPAKRDWDFHEWKFMAPLKLLCSCGGREMFLISMNENSWLHWSLSVASLEIVRMPISMNENSWLHWSHQVPGWSPPQCQFPWMKIHGSIEAHNKKRRWVKWISIFPWMKIHGSIEAYEMNLFPMVESLDFHEWKFMAPLKPVRHGLLVVASALFPWMKIHGSIEAFCGRKGTIQTVEFPWMKIHGSIEANRMTENEEKLTLFPWMKIHGSIEAQMNGTFVADTILHFHEWKFMAPLKPQNRCITEAIHEKHFHEWKFMAPLKQSNHRSLRIASSQFPWMKIHGSIEACQDTIGFSRVSWFPWMKIHGSIEAFWWSWWTEQLRKISMNENSWLHWSM